MLNNSNRDHPNVATINDLIEVEQAVLDRVEQHETDVADTLRLIRGELEIIVERLKK